MSHGISRGTAPLSVAKQDLERKKLLASIGGEQPPLPPELLEFAESEYEESEPVSQQSTVMDEPDQPGSSYDLELVEEARAVKERVEKSERHEPAEPIVFEHPDFRIEFKVFEVSIIDRQVGLRVPKGAGFTFKPKIDSNYEIIYRGNHYRVSYLGGTFQFGADSSQIITFLIYSEDDGEERQSGGGEESQSGLSELHARHH